MRERVSVREMESVRERERVRERESVRERERESVRESVRGDGFKQLYILLRAKVTDRQNFELDLTRHVVVSSSELV